MIKKQNISTLQHTIITGTQIVEYTWIKQQEQQHIVIQNQWKQYIADNFEWFLILFVLFYCVTVYFMYKAFSKKTKNFIVQIRKESTTSDDLQCSFRQSTEQNEQQKREESSSTESSPKIKQTIPNQNIVELPQEEIKLNGHKISEIREKSIRIEKNNDDNIITKIETQQVIQKIQANDEQQKAMGGQFGGLNISNLKGVLMTDYDFGNGKQERIIQILTDWSQYCENGKFEKKYQQSKIIGKGAFGEVFKCQKIFDLKEYAVKRIYFKVQNEKTLRDHPIFREINTLQEINHKNIVRYYTSWIEELNKEMMAEISKLNQLVAEKQQNQFDNNDSFTNSYQPQLMIDDMSINVQFIGDNTNNYKTQNEQQISSVLKQKQYEQSLASFHFSDYSSQVQSRMRRLHFNPNQQDGQYQLYMLYIEMELCDFTLKDFIDRVDRSKDQQLIKSIFIQIIEGIIYMHRNKYIHRDLKPQNIFINSKNEVKIGDLGLCNGIIKKDDDLYSINEEQTNNIGTPLYMAPEVKDDVYGFPADIYALGIILFEMLYKMKTEFEKIRLINNLTKDLILPGLLLKDYPKEADLILRMVSKNPQNRPTASQIYDTLNNL